MKELSEKQIERYLRDQIRDQGGMALKFVSPGCRGVPDRLVFLPGGRLYLIELKTQSGSMSKLQKHLRKKFTRLGFDYRVIRSVQQVDEFIQEIRGGDEKHV